MEYAAMLFRNQEANFTILHVKTPCKKESCSGKCGIVFDQKLKKDQETLESKISKHHNVNRKFVEASYIESIRQVVAEEQIQLIILGTSSQNTFDTGLFFDKKTLEIITKVKCSIVLVPEETKIEVPKTALLPTDFSITSDYSIFNILNSLSFVNHTQLSLLSVEGNKTMTTNKTHSRDLISKVIQSLDFETIEEIKLTSKTMCINGFDMVMVMAKNLSIFQNIFSTSPTTVCLPKVPILFLHDSKKV
jgi:hypothetical protein